MRIIQLTANNFKRLVAVEITPDGDLVLLSGKNDAGKSSVLDAIWAALGGKGACPDKPIREGAEKGDVRLVLDNGLVVERTFTAKGSYLKVTADEGTKQYNKPQDMLDALVGKIAFDPLAFARKKPKEQTAELLKVVDVGIDLEQHELERGALYDKRTDANREVKRLEGALAKQVHYDDAPAAPIVVADLITEIQEAEKVQAELERARNRLEEIGAEMRRLREEEERLTEILTAPHPEEVNVAELKARLADAERLNEYARANERYGELKAELEDARAEATKHDADLKAHDELKDAALEQAAFPVPGLSFNDEGILYNGIPFAQCSSSEQLKVAVAVAMAANPDLRVIQIREGSLLDRESLDVIAELAGARDYQVWAEVVDESGAVGVVIEDGVVAAKAGRGDRAPES